MAKSKKKSKKKEKKKIIRKPAVLKKRKKKWVSILAPKSFGGKELGESFVVDPLNLKGKNVVVSLSNLGRGRNSSIKVIFDIKDVVEGNCVSEVKGYYIMNSFARRIVKKGKSKIFKSFKFKTKDDFDVILKLALVTKNKIVSGVRKSIGKELETFIAGEVKKNTFDNVLNSIIEYKFQKSIMEKLKKIYPVASLEVLMFKRV